VYFRRAGHQSHPVAVACAFLVLSLSLFCGVSQKQATFALAILKLIVDWLTSVADIPGEQRQALQSIPKDYRTLLKHFDLDPRLRIYVCCPACFALYDDSSPLPDTCTFRKAPDQPPCAADLFKTRSIRGVSFKRPIRKYAHQDLKHWVGRMLSRSDSEALLEASTSGHAGFSLFFLTF
jgi:hypothetical protein